LRRHPHPMTVHFPIAFMILFPIFNVLYLLTGNQSLETSAFHVLSAGLAAAPVAMLTGPYNWWLNYGAKWSQVIAVKVFGSLFLLVLILITFFWRLNVPGIMLQPTEARAIYLTLNFTIPVVVTVLGWFGAKMTFPH